MIRSRFVVLMLLAILPLLGGCVPTVVWLPDGSGFVYTEKNWSRLVHFDLASGTRTVLVENTGTETILPAVSPDGKRFGLASAKRHPDGTFSVRVILYDRQGDVIAQSKPSPPAAVGETNAEKSKHLLALHAIPDGRLAVHIVGDPGATWLYDADEDSFAGPVAQDPFAWLSGYAVRPDGKGIITTSETESDDLSGNYLHFRTWDGESHEIQFVEGFPENVSEQQAIGPVEWDGAICRVLYPTLELTIDTDVFTARVTHRDPGHALGASYLKAFHIFPEGPGRLCYFYRLQLYQDSKSWLEFQDITTGERQRLMDDVMAMQPFSPSPDGKLVATRVWLPEQEQILVVDSEGNVRHRVDVFATQEDYGLGKAE